MEDQGRQRLLSLDALRGADLFWIMGGKALVIALAAATQWGPFVWIASQCHHVEWHGFRFYDLIFPLFLFLAGVSMPISFAKRLAAGASQSALSWHAIRRGVALVLMGMVYNGLLAFDWENLRCASVLGRIGLAWMLAALLVIWLSHRAQFVCFVTILLGYWAVLTLVPVPDSGVASLEAGQTFADWFDRHYLPGRLYQGVRDPEGLFSTLPAVCTALAGVFAGRWLSRLDQTEHRRILGLIAFGLLALGLGKIWDLALPFNKNLWSSSFVLWCAGWSLLLLALFYWLIDVRGWQRWCGPFVVFGANSILIYMLSAFVDFRAATEFVIGDASPGLLHPVFLPAGVLTLKWLVLRWLYRRRLFLRV